METLNTPATLVPLRTRSPREAPEVPSERFPRARRIAAVGWSAEVAAALDALEATGSFEAVGVADPSGATLVQARQATGLPCFQQVSQFLHNADYDALLVAGPRAVAAAALGAARGAALLAVGPECDAEALRGLVEVAEREGVPLAVLRPESHDAGVADLVRLVRSDDAWEPYLLDITVEAPTEVDRLLAVAASYAMHLAPARHGLVRATSWATPVRAVAAALEAGARQTHLRVRHGPEAFVRITGDALAGSFELLLGAGAPRLSYVRTTGEHVEYRPESVAHWAAEATRTAAGADDTMRAREEAVLLDAIARAVLTGEAQRNDCCARPDLRVIEGDTEGDGRATPRHRNLRLVVS